MQNLLLSSLFALSAFGVALAEGRGPSAAVRPARFVLAEIRVDGVTILRASTSDDGSADVDAVWDYQRAALAYEETADFAKAASGRIVIAEVEGRHECRLCSPEPSEHEGKSSRRVPVVEVDVRHGGRSVMFETRLVEDKDAEGRARWRLPVDEIERMFSHREISRREAGQLLHPQRKK
jgi:hypothetical protein